MDQNQKPDAKQLIERLTIKGEQLKSENAALRQELSETQRRCLELETSLKTARAEIDQLNRSMEQGAQAVEVLMRKNEELMRENAELKREHQSSMEDLATRVASLLND